MRDLLNSVTDSVHPTQVFDLIAGTSTGSLIAFGLVCGKDGEPMSPDDIIQMYKEETKNIFKRRKAKWWQRALTKPQRMLYDLILKRNCVPYSQSGLAATLAKQFGERTLKTFSMSGCGAAAVVRQFNEDPTQPDELEIFDTVDPPISHNVSEVLKASACAPVFFETPAIIHTKTYIDGGVGGNCPIALAIPRMQKLNQDKTLGLVLSVAPPVKKTEKKLAVYKKYEGFQYWLKYFPTLLTDGFASYETTRKNHEDGGAFMRLNPKSKEAQKFDMDEKDVEEMLQAIIQESVESSQYFEGVLLAAVAVTCTVKKEATFSEEHFDLIAAVADMTSKVHKNTNLLAYILSQVVKQAKKVMLQKDTGDRMQTVRNICQKIVVFLDNLGNCHMEMGNYAEAVKWHEQNLQMRKAIFGEKDNNPGIARSINNLGLCHMKMGNYAEAVKWHEQSLQIRMAIHREESNHLDIASSLGNLGLCHWNMGNYAEAVKWHEQSLQMREAIHGEGSNHPDIAASFGNLGLCHWNMGNYAEAVKWHEQSLQMERAIHGEGTNHPDIAASLDSLGLCHREMGNYAEAVKWHEQSLQMRKAIHRERTNHPDIAASLNNLGSCHVEMGNCAEAVKWHEQSLQMQRAIHGEGNNHPDIAVSLDSLGLCYRKMGNYAEAAKWHKQSLQMRKAIHGEETNHPDIATTLLNLTVALQTDWRSVEYHTLYVKMKDALDKANSGK